MQGTHLHQQSTSQDWCTSGEVKKCTTAPAEHQDLHQQSTSRDRCTSGEVLKQNAPAEQQSEKLHHFTSRAPRSALVEK